jgi:hypothetical protein
MTENGNDLTRLEHAGDRIDAWLGECTTKDTISMAFFLYQELTFLDDETLPDE